MKIFEKTQIYTNPELEASEITSDGILCVSLNAGTEGTGSPYLQMPELENETDW